MLSLGTESLTLLGLALLLLVASPVAAACAIVFFGITSFFLNRQLKRRSVEVGDRLVEYALLQFKAAIHAIGGVKEIQLRRNGEYFVHDFARNKKQTAEAQRLATAARRVPEVRAGDPLRRRHGADGGRGVRDRERPVGRPHARALPRGRHADAAVPGPADHGPQRDQRRPAGHADDRRRPARVPGSRRAARPARRARTGGRSRRGEPDVPLPRARPSRSCATSASRCRTAPRWRSSGPAGRARPPWSTCCSACTPRPRGR